MNTKTALLTLAIAASFAGVASAQEAASTTTTTDTTVVTTTEPAPPADATVAAASTESAPPADTAATTLSEPLPPPDMPAAATTAATSPMSELDMRTALTAQGYTDIQDLKFEDGMWTAEAKSADGNKVDLKIDGTTGKAIPDETVSSIDKDAVIASLLAAKYTDAHDVKFEDGVWVADAKDPTGAEVEVKLDATDGHILGTEKDEADEKAEADEGKDADEKEDTDKKN
jgi:hypothetical protein